MKLPSFSFVPEAFSRGSARTLYSAFAAISLFGCYESASGESSALDGDGGSAPGEDSSVGEGDDAHPDDSADEGEGEGDEGEAGEGDEGEDDEGDDGDSEDSGDPATLECGVQPTTQLPLLTREQYDRTIRDLLLLDTQPSSMLAPDGVGSIDSRAWTAFQNAAEALASQVMATPTSRAHVIRCATEDAACASETIAAFGARAFRRPLTSSETERFEGLFADRETITETGSFDEAMELIIRAFLISPPFLTRSEITEEAEGDFYALSDYEVASRLSYTLWGTMPDEELFEAADAGALSTREEIAVQAARMLAHENARDNVAAFHQGYALMGPGTRWSDITADSERYPLFTSAQAPLMLAETELFFEHVVFEMGGSFQDLLTAPVGFVNAELAPLYGLDPADYGDALEAVDLDPQTRAGVFTRLGFLAAHNNHNRTSPILRGAFIQEQVLCRDIPPPPPDVVNTPLPTENEDGEALTTNRERVDAQTAAGECISCHHGVVNPTGFAFELYDAAGSVQVTDNGEPVNSLATVPLGSSSVEVADAVELMEAIANAPEAQACYAQKWVKYAYRRDTNPVDTCTVEGLASRMSDGDYSVLELLGDLTQTQSFRYRAVEDAP